MLTSYPPVQEKDLATNENITVEAQNRPLHVGLSKAKRSLPDVHNTNRVSEISTRNHRGDIFF